MTYSLHLILLVVVMMLRGYTLQTTSTISPPVTIAYRGLYVDGFKSILGNTSKEDLLLNWSASNNFNALSLYDLNQIMGRPARVAQLAQFIRKARVTFGIDKIAAVRGTSANFIQNAQYDSSRTDLNERFSVYNLENEWWNNGPTCNFSCYTSILQTMETSAKNVTPSMTTEAYIGWFKNPDGQELNQANTLVNFLDRIMVHDYQKSPQLSYMTSRLSFLGQAAKNQSRIMDAIVIFSAEPDFMYDYFNVTSQNHSFEDAYVNILNQFNATSFDSKDHIRIIGYQIFDYSYAHMARPT
jgi:hypothetical protein